MSQEEIENEALETEVEDSSVKKAANHGVCRLGKIEIDCNVPLPQYDNGEVKAYSAGVGNGVQGQFFALVCEKHLTPRIGSIQNYQSIINPLLADLVKTGVVEWPVTKSEHYVFVYANNLGTPLLKKGEPLALSWRQDEVMECLVRPIIGVLQDFRDKGIFHGGIRPDNMYGGVTPKIERVLLGDCLSAPVSSAQPALYEPIERAMAPSLGRGIGTEADDLYALGISISVLMRSNDPLKGMSDKEIIKQKMEYGSYAAVTGKDRFTGSILELLRGLLQDDYSQRWTIDEVLVWLEGRRISPKQTMRQRKAARPMVVGGEKYLQRPLLAMGFAENPEEAHKLIEDGNLEQWMRRSLDDMDSVELLHSAMTNASDSGRGAGYSNRLISYVSCVLDVNAPARFKGVSLMVDAVGTVLANYMVQKEDLALFQEMFKYGILTNWAGVQENPAHDVSVLVSRFDSCRDFMRQKKMEYGIERCLYFLNQETHCLSEKLKGYFVLGPSDFIYACEEMCKKGKAPAFFIDRHGASFLSIKDHKVIDTSLYDLNSSEEYKRILGNLRCLAEIQKREKLGSFPAIAEVFIDVLPCVYNRYHDKDIRKKLQNSVEKSAAKGDLVKMANVLDNVDVVNRDMSAFRSAMIEYSDLRKEYKALEEGLADKSTFGRRTGRDISAIFSSVCAAIIILVIVFLYIK